MSFIMMSVIGKRVFLDSKDGEGTVFFSNNRYMIAIFIDSLAIILEVDVLLLFRTY